MYGLSGAPKAELRSEEGTCLGRSARPQTPTAQDYHHLGGNQSGADGKYAIVVCSMTVPSEEMRRLTIQVDWMGKQKAAPPGLAGKEQAQISSPPAAPAPG